MTNESPVDRSSEASKGGYQGIKKVRGVFMGTKVVPGRFKREGEEEARNQAETKLEDAAILEMEEGEDEPDLKDGVFTIWMGYAQKGKKPHQNSLYIKGFIASGEEIIKAQGHVDAEGNPTKGVNEFFPGQFVTLERRSVHLFTNDKDEDVSYDGWCFVEDEGSGGLGIEEHVKGLLLGKNVAAAKRALLIDARAKQFPDYKEALFAGTIGELIPDIALVDDIFVDLGQYEEAKQASESEEASENS